MRPQAILASVLRPFLIGALGLQLAGCRAPESQGPGESEATLRIARRTIYVGATASGENDGSTWENAYTELHNALNQAKSGDTVFVWEGTYKPFASAAQAKDTPTEPARGRSGPRYATFQLKKRVAVYGGFPSGGGSWEKRDPAAHRTTLSGDIGQEDNPDDNSYHVVTGSGTNATAVLDGFTITGGNASGSSDGPDNGGGGMLNVNGSPTIANCRFWRNSAAVHGGGMLNVDHSNPTLTDCEFEDNSAFSGGGMSNRQSSPTVIHCAFEGNRAMHAGALSNLDSSHTTLRRCTLSNNKAESSGGAVSNDGWSVLELTNCLLVGNTSGDAGGAMVTTKWTRVSLVNCTLCKNAATGRGGGISSAVADLNLTNCIVWGNADGRSDEKWTAQIDCPVVDRTGPVLAMRPRINYCCIEGWPMSWPEHIIPPGEHNMGGQPDFDPLFRNAEEGDFRLGYGSACIDSGDNAAASGGKSDLDDQPRFFDDPRTKERGNATAVVDMGAYEYRVSLDLSADWCEEDKTYYAGDRLKIAWTTTGRIPKVNLQYSLDNNRNGLADDNNWFALDPDEPAIANPEDEQGQYSWTVPEIDYDRTQTNAVQCFIRITDPDAKTVVDTSSRTATLSAAKLVLSEQWCDKTYYPTDAVDVEWTTFGVVQSVRLEYWDETGKNWRAIHEGDSIKNEGRYRWSPLPEVEGETSFRIRISDAGEGKKTVGDASQRTAALVPPRLDFSEDWCRKTYYPADTVDIRWTTYGVVENVTLEYSMDDNANGLSDDENWLALNADEPTLANPEAGRGHYAWKVPDVDGAGPCRIRISAADTNRFVKADTSCSFTLAATNIIMVNGNTPQDGYTSGRRGGTWDEAFGNLQDALNAAKTREDVNQIWVAQGTYKPDRGDPSLRAVDPRKETFTLLNKVAVYGGFRGTEVRLDQRDWSEYKTVLSGDVGATDTDSVYDSTTWEDNIYHVVTGSGTDNTAVLDGFTITHGRANGPNEYGGGGGMFNDHGSPLVRNCTFVSNSAKDFGAGMYNRNASKPTLVDCTFKWNNDRAMVNDGSDPSLIRCKFLGNRSHWRDGAGMCNINQSKPVLTHCIFVGNTAYYESGGAMHNMDSAPTLIHCVLACNQAHGDGGGISNHGSIATLTNCILWGNQVTESQCPTKQCRQISFSPYASTIEPTDPRFAAISFSCIQHLHANLRGNGNIADDPRFVRLPEENSEVPGERDEDGWGDRQNVPGLGEARNDDYGDLGLTAGSPCIRSGSGDKADIGAYKHAP